VAKVAAEPVELPHDERVAVTERLQARLKAGAVIELTARGVAVQIALGNTRSDKCVALQVEDL
jgi:hypothetical protein